jgi:Flp pilus assembly pilin Flp
MLTAIKTFLNDEHGLETVEWAIVGGTVTMGMVLILASLGGWVDQQYGELQANTKSAPMMLTDSNFNVPSLEYGAVVPWMSSTEEL